MVSPTVVASCLALLAPARGFVSPIVTRTPGAQIAAASRASSVRHRAVARRGDLSMRKTGKFVLSKKALNDDSGPTSITVNMKSGEMIKEEKKEAPKEEMAKAGPGLLEPDMELFCKAAADGNALGDCPFTHYVHMVLQYKGLPFKLTPVAPDAKPDWLVEDYEGQMPCLVDSKEAYTESANIVDYVEYFYPEPTLSIKDSDAVAKAKEVTSGVFGSLAKCIKNLNPKEDPMLIADAMAELKKVDAFLKKGKGPYLCGEELTLADCSFAPKLYHASTCLAQFKNTVISPDLASLHKYMDAIYSHEAFTKSSYPPDVIVWGWNNARGTQAK
ncbi:unnamed protein product [Ectocarpus sp. 6 AP-2014]